MEPGLGFDVRLRQILWPAAIRTLLSQRVDAPRPALCTEESNLPQPRVEVARRASSIACCGSRPVTSWYHAG